MFSRRGSSHSAQHLSKIVSYSVFPAPASIPLVSALMLEMTRVDHG